MITTPRTNSSAITRVLIARGLTRMDFKVRTRTAMRNEKITWLNAAPGKGDRLASELTAAGYVIDHRAGSDYILINGKAA